MIKKLNLLIVLAAAAGVAGIVAVMNQTRSREGIAIKGKVISIYGRNYTLAKVAALAAELGHAEAFSYDAKKREAMANASLLVYGSLQIGDPADAALGETLLLNTIVCGDLRVEVARGGELRVYHSVIQTVSQILTQEKCSRGYYFLTDGVLKAADSRILYMSGARGPTAMRDARVDLQRVAFALSDDCSFHTYGVDGKRLVIQDTQFLCEGAYGFQVEGAGGAPVRLVRCRLVGTDSDLYLAGDRPAAELVDCQFSKSKVRFYQGSGRVAVRWTVGARVVERGTGKPLAGVEVVATSAGAGPAETVKGRTGADGGCSLELTEYIAEPNSPAGQDLGTVVTPHRIAALSAVGKVLAEVKGHEARGPGEAVTLEVSPADLVANR